MRCPVGLRSAFAVASVVAGLAACGSARPPSAPPSTSGEVITGRERLGWDQLATTPAELSSFGFALYVDGVRSVLSGVACDTASRPEGFACSAPLPPLSAGPRLIELATFITRGDRVVESTRSAPLRVTVSASGTGAGVSGAPEAGTFVTRDGARLVAETVAGGLTEPVDLAQAADGRLFVAERGGRVLVVEPESGRAGVALELDDVDARGDGGLLSLSVHPAFETTGHVFVVYTTLDGGGARTFQLVRFREAGGRLAERAVLLDGIPAGEAGLAASVRFGPDGQLYVAIESPDRPELTDDLASYAGKMLRLSETGALPRDNPLPSLVYAWGHPAVRGFDWQPATTEVWVVGRGASLRDELTRITPGRAAEGGRWMLSRGAQPGAAGVAFYRGSALPGFEGDLLVATAEGGHLLRVRFDADDPGRPSETESLFGGWIGPLGAVAVGLDGAIYVCTNVGGPAGDDRLIRIRPAS